ncbi:MAG: cytochrome C [Chlorobi bacterium]|nr:cytochrome C [Chlorobiota bacterium]
MNRPAFVFYASIIMIHLSVQSASTPEAMPASHNTFTQACLEAASGPIPSPDIRNSHHDFSGASWSGNQICRPCHVPHNAITTVPNSPLWSHQLSTASYTVYSSSTLDAQVNQPLGTTKLCLSCHDGTVAIENHAGQTNGTRYTTWGKVGTDLRDDHPISFVYNTALATSDGELYDPSTRSSGLGGTIEDDLLDNGRVECSTCHDPHISRNTQGCSGCHNAHGGFGMTGRTLSLRVDNAGSALCLTCHKK